MTDTLKFNATIETLLTRDLEIRVTVWFSGDTYPHKDEIKAIGGYWFYSYLPEYGKTWNKTIKLNDLQDEIEKAIEIGAEICFSEDDLLNSRRYKVEKMIQEEERALRKRLNAQS